MTDKTDRELLEMAAKAAGYASWDFLAGEDGNLMNVYADDGHHDVWWPLEDDGDALRLAVRLGITVGPSTGRPDYCIAEGKSRRGMTPYFMEAYGEDKFAATRRAIVRAAAAIGESMP